MKLQVFAILLAFIVFDCEARSLEEVPRAKRSPQFPQFPGGGNYG